MKPTNTTLFNKDAKDYQPLAFRMRPRNLDEFIGQEDIIGPETPLRRMIEADKLSSLIFYGPAGTGKTSLAMVIANMTAAAFEEISAVTAGVKDIRAVLKRAKERQQETGKQTILFIDEIHRFNKSQQDALLPAVETGVVVLTGATTENPFFEVNSPLLSRSHVHVLKPLSANELQRIIAMALTDKERGLGELKLTVSKKALDYLANITNGDARKALSNLEIAARVAVEEKKGKGKISLKIIEEVAGARLIIYDRQGDAHFDTISAFIKSMRGGDPDAALYWLARMIYAGEDPKFIARRMVILASEDIGNADPRALQVATAAAQAVQFVGLPECRLNLAQAAIYLAVAPKSNAVIKGIDSALTDVRRAQAQPVPKHLRDSHYTGAKKLDHGRDYKNPHNYQDQSESQEYLPKNLQGRRYYKPANSGLEKSISEVLKKKGK